MEAWIEELLDMNGGYWRSKFDCLEIEWFKIGIKGMLNG